MIVLSPPWDPGSKDEGKSYTHADILDVHQDFKRNVIVLRWQLGCLVDGEFEPGKEPPDVFEISGENFDAFITYLQSQNAGAIAAYRKSLAQAIIYAGRLAGTAS